MPTQNYRQLEIPGSFRYAKETETAIVNSARELGYSSDDVFALKICLEEALTNAIQHGHKGDHRQTINIRYYVSSSQIEIFIEDKGSGFDYANVPDPTAEKNLELPSGRGVMLMRAYMDTVGYNDKGNVVHLVKIKSTEKENKW